MNEKYCPFHGLLYTGLGILMRCKSSNLCGFKSMIETRYGLDGKVHTLPCGMSEPDWDNCQENSDENRRVLDVVAKSIDVLDGVLDKMSLLQFLDWQKRLHQR